MDLYYKRLPLCGAVNVRDLGGFITVKNAITKYKEFIRCESPFELTEGDILFLKKYGISTVLDFRSKHECEKNPSKFIECDWIKYVHLPAFSANVKEVDLMVDWGEKYIELLENYKKWICTVMHNVAYSKGAILYNCTTGKDRTGVITALLLKLAYVADCDIIADYVVSQIYLSDKYASIFSDISACVSYNEPFFKTEPESMKQLLNFIENKYGSVKRYLNTCGVSDEEIFTIRNRLLQKI